MNLVSRTAIAALLASTLTGCIYVNGEHISTSDWQSEQKVNRETISQLALGTTAETVIQQLGSPTDSEAFLDGSTEVRVLFYRTRRTEADGDTSRDETTPLVFKNNELVGWGLKVYENLR
jgi:hypothetical protein